MKTREGTCPRVIESEDENDDVGMSTHIVGKPGARENPGAKDDGKFWIRVPSIGVEFNEQVTRSSSGYSKRMRVWEGEKCVKKVSCETHGVLVSELVCVEQGTPGCASLIQEPVQEDARSHARTHEIRRAMQREENRRINGGWSKQVWMKFDGKSRPWDIGVEERGRELREMEERKWNGG